MTSWQKIRVKVLGIGVLASSGFQSDVHVYLAFKAAMGSHEIWPLSPLESAFSE